LLPFFSHQDEVVTNVVVPKPLQSQRPQPIQAEVAEKPAASKVFRKFGLSHTPSIKGALAGFGQENNKETVEETPGYSQYDESLIEPFTEEQLIQRWKEFVEKMADRPSLCSALSTVPEIIEDYKLVLRIGNSVQEEDIRLIKPELISYLRKTLRNARIELSTRLERMETERSMFSDSEKMQMMMQKNPLLNELKQRFNLDFTD